MSKKKLLLLFSLQVMSDSFVTLWTVARQASLSKGLPRQEYWSGLPFPSPGDLLDPWIEPASPALQADYLPLSQKKLCILIKNTLLLKVLTIF